MRMEVRASAKFQRFSPRKARLVTDLITGKPAEEAIALLQHLDKAAAVPIGRVVRSAIANAENNYNMTLENLYVKRAVADEGPRMKRIWMRGRGRRDTKLRRTSHITVIVDDTTAGGLRPPRTTTGGLRPSRTPRVAGGPRPPRTPPTTAGPRPPRTPRNSQKEQ